MRSYAYLNTTQKIIDAYDGSLPLAAWLKQFFATDKKYGSRDRREISHLCYSFYRLGKAFQEKSREERILLGTFLCSLTFPFVIRELKPEWMDQEGKLPEEKMTAEELDHCLQHLFPFTSEVSAAIDKDAFVLSFLLQPDLHIRVRPGYLKNVLARIKEHIPVLSQDGDCITLSSQSKVDEFIRIDEEAVIQDASSQKVLQLLLPYIPQQSRITAWDCCAASGGKSILLHDLYPKARLTVSDIRPSIIANLKKRFQRAGIRHYDAFVADVQKGEGPAEKFDLIICDAPCSGSGTWGRTPEQLSFFPEEKIDHYASLQKSIAFHASRQLKQKGYLLYITCSVFEKENEAVAKWLEEKGLNVLSSQYFTGYHQKADTLFAALLTHTD